MKRFVRRARGGTARPTRTWVSLNAGYALSAITATTSATLLSLQAPTSLTLTSDPPEDMTVLRIRGSMNVLLSAAGSWTLALLVQDTTWTPSTAFEDDADKRILFSQTFRNTLATTKVWNPDGTVEYGSGGVTGVTSNVTQVDISPKVRIGAGQALFLVGYEDTGAAALTVDTAEMRLLFQRSGRR